MHSPRWITPLLYGLIFIGAAIAGFVYTDRYSGWGHHSANAAPVGLGLGAVSAFVAAIVVSEMNTRKMFWTLSIMASLSILGAGLIWFLAP